MFTSTSLYGRYKSQKLNILQFPRFFFLNFLSFLTHNPKIWGQKGLYITTTPFFFLRTQKRGETQYRWDNKTHHIAWNNFLWPENSYGFRNLKPTEWAPGNSRGASTTKYMTTRNDRYINFIAQTDPTHPCWFCCISFFCSHVTPLLQLYP